MPPHHFGRSPGGPPAWARVAVMASVAPTNKANLMETPGDSMLDTTARTKLPVNRRAGGRIYLRPRYVPLMGLFSRHAPPSLDSVRFDASGYEAKGDPQPGRQRVWWSPDGDGVGLYVFTIPPDLPRASTVGD